MISVTNTFGDVWDDIFTSDFKQSACLSIFAHKAESMEGEKEW